MNNYVNELLDKQQKKRRVFPVSPAGQPGRTRPCGNSRANSGRNFPGADSSKGGAAGRKSSPKPAFRPAGISSRFEENTWIIEKVKQSPARVLHKKYTAPPRKVSFFHNRPVERGEPKPVRSSRERQPPKRDLPSFTLPLVPFTTFFLLAFGVFIVIHSQGGNFDWLGREVVNIEKDEGGQYSLALYAGISSPENPVDEGETIPLDLTETFAWKTYKVRSGDSVSKIAAAFSISMDAIIASNGITNARALREGEVLRIPNMDGIPYTVKSGDSFAGISRAMGVPLEAILDANDIQSDAVNAGKVLFIPGARMNREDLKLALGELFIHPLKGARLSSPFGWRNDPISGVRRHHAAIDLSAVQGTPIKAAMDGKISALGFNGTYGNYIIITHNGGFQTMYAHLYSFSVKNGVQVKQGAQIGTVGSTGYSTGPHLHFAVFKNSRAVNPLDYLSPRG